MLLRYTFVSLGYLLFTVAPCTVNGQAVQGYVLDALSGDSLVDAHVLNIARRTGTVTNADGYFSATAQAGDSLRFTSTGYRSQTVLTTARPMMVRLIPDTVMLPGVSVLANRVNMYRDTLRQPLRLPGVPHIKNPVRVKPMTWTWGRKEFSDDAPKLPVLGVSASLRGPISYFMRYEKDQKKYEREQQAAFAQQGYREALSDEALRKLLIHKFDLTDRVYDSLLVCFNQEQAHLVRGVNREEAAGLLFRFFSDALRPRK